MPKSDNLVVKLALALIVASITFLYKGLFKYSPILISFELNFKLLFIISKLFITSCLVTSWYSLVI